MPISDYVINSLKLGVSQGVENLPNEEKRKLAGLVSYLIQEKSVYDLEDALENAKLLSIALNKATKDIYLVGNFVFAGGGMAISGTSILKYCKTKNTIARGFYVASSLCGGAAAVAGALKGVEGTCGLSFIAVGGDAFGTAFLFVGNKAQKLGDYIDGKRKWTNFNPRSFLRRRQISKTGMGYRGMSFVTSSGPISFEGVHQIIQRIPYENIIIIGGTIFTVYGYIKILISIYRYLDAKFSPKIDHSQIIHNSALFLINSINNIDSVKKTNRIYIAALKMEYGIVS